MKSRVISYSLYVILLFLWSACSPINAQDPYLQKGNRFVREESTQITRQYLPQLIMGSEQALQFREKVAEFLIRRNEVLGTDWSRGKKLYYLRKIWERESLEMADILRYEQLKLYHQLKREIQPMPAAQKRGYTP